MPVSRSGAAPREQAGISLLQEGEQVNSVPSPRPAGNGQTLPIGPCRMRYVYQGLDPGVSGDYNSLPWRMGLLTQANSSC